MNSPTQQIEKEIAYTERELRRFLAAEWHETAGILISKLIDLKIAEALRKHESAGGHNWSL